MSFSNGNKLKDSDKHVNTTENNELSTKTLTKAKSVAQFFSSQRSNIYAKFKSGTKKFLKLSKKKTFYNIFVLPATETLKENIIIDDNKNIINIADNLPKLTDRDINIIFNPK